MVLEVRLLHERRAVLRQVSCMGLAVPSSADCPGGQDAQATSAQPPELLPLPHHQHHQRRHQQRYSGTKVRGPRVPFLRELPHSRPLLLRKARPQAPATPALKSRMPRFFSLDEARAVTEAWREDYNHDFCPHGALGNQTLWDIVRPVAGHAQLPALNGYQLGWFCSARNRCGIDSRSRFFR